MQLQNGLKWSLNLRDDTQYLSNIIWINLHCTSTVLILDTAGCPIPFSTTHWYLPAWDLVISSNVKLSLYEISIFVAETLYHLMFGVGLAAVTLHWRVRLLPSVTVWSYGKLKSSDGGSAKQSKTKQKTASTTSICTYLCFLCSRTGEVGRVHFSLKFTRNDP